MQHMQHIQQRGLKMSSRERNTKLIVQNQNKLAAYGSGVGVNGPMSGVGSNKRAGGLGSGGVRHHGQYQLMNRKASEEKFQSNPGMAVGSGNLYGQNRKASIDQHRYKSHLRNQEANHNVGLIRNQSKPTLQLPEINSSAMIGPGGGR